MTIAPERVMVVMAHPDDPEFLAGGTIATLAREGREITYVLVTNGNKGSDDPAITSERRAPIGQDEQRQAARVLGVERGTATAASGARATSLGTGKGHAYAEGFDRVALPG